MQPVNTGVAYLLWCLCFFGICGGQRLYTGNIGSGVLYLLTFGFFGIGQLVDLATIPEMVSRRNHALGSGNAIAGVNQSITLNIGDVPQLTQLKVQPRPQHSVPGTTTKTPLQKLLVAAKNNGGTLSIAQAVMHTEIEPSAVKQLLLDAQRNGLAEIGNDPNSGAIRYIFDV
ncbi:MAG: TM2 domain-containing protein [Cyanobacteria bacterium J06560_6]